jgi:molybdopterin-guanine dinucleotide biosynthesis protein A
MINSAGIVLCGGESRRMGSPKAWLRVGNELMLPRVVRLLNEAVDLVVVVAATGQDLPPIAAEVVRDELDGRGPMQGLAAGLASLTGRAEVAFVSSCDVPFLRPLFVRRVLDLLGEHSICVPRVDERLHPLAAAYRVSVLPEVQRLLAKESLKMQELFNVVATRVVTADQLRDVDPNLESLRNVNTPAEYEQAIADLS